MAIHSPACEKYLHELSTAPNDSADHQVATVVSRLSEPRALQYLMKLMDDGHGTHLADVARQIWHLAADTTENEKAAR